MEVPVLQPHGGPLSLQSSQTSQPFVNIDTGATLRLECIGLNMPKDDNQFS